MDDEQRIIVGFVGIVLILAYIMSSIDLENIGNLLLKYGKYLILVVGIMLLIISVLSKEKYEDSEYTNRVLDAEKRKF